MSRRSLENDKMHTLYAMACMAVIAALFFCGGPVFGAEAKKGGMLQKEGAEKTPTVITSKKMNADNKSKLIVFTTDVVAVKGESTLYADEMTVYYTEDGKDIDRIVCKGNVKIVKGVKTAVSKEAVYYNRPEGESVVMTGEPKVWEGNNLVTGTKITLLLDEDRSIVEESRVTLYPKNKD